MPVQQQPMTPMPFYADPNRFPTPVWQADPSQGWTQGQFIQQIPTAGQPIETYQQYPNGIYQATYQQPAFETNTFYTGAVQVLTNPRPPSASNQQVQLAPPRPNSNYSHTPSPSPVQQQQQQTNTGRQYQEYNIAQQTGGQQQSSQQNFIQSGSGATGNESSQTGSNSRPGSVNTIMNPPTPNPNFSPQTHQQQQQQQSQQQSSQQQTNNTYTSISNFSPNPSVNYVNANSGNAQPGYPQVNSSSPQLTSLNSSGYPGQEQYSGQEHDQWQNDGQIMWEQQVKVEPSYEHQDRQNNQYMQEVNNSPSKIDNVHIQTDKQFSQADKVNLNTRIKTMILNKQQENNKMEESKAVEQNSTGHFLSYSHHHHLKKRLGDDGGFQNRYDSKQYVNLPPRPTSKSPINAYNIPLDQRRFAQMNNVLTHEMSNKHNMSINNFQSNKPSNPHSNKNLNFAINRTDQNAKREQYHDTKYDSFNHQMRGERQNDEFYQRYNNFSKSIEQQMPREGSYQDFKPISPINRLPPVKPATAKEKRTKSTCTSTPLKAKSVGSPDKCNKQIGMEIPECKCFPPDQTYTEPGTYYTHLGCANNLKSLRYDLECRTGVTGISIRIEKLRYTGKEGKTSQGCPIAKWVIRRQDENEKYLVLVKQRKGHHCHSAFIVIGFVVWEGITQGNADELYSLLTDKLNKFGLPTKRRCSTNDPRTCACQGISENTCGASFTFGCSWSMYYNGCKFTRSKEVRKFRMTEKNDEAIVEEKLQNLSDHISPIYRCLAPQSFKNQCRFEDIASDCRLGRTPGRPFSGVTACMDFCAHSHKDMHNMIDGCTVVVTLTKHKGFSKPPEEQLHVLPLYVPEDTDEFGSKENQEQKVVNGGIEVLEKYSCEVRTSSTPAEKCVVKRTKKKKGEDGKKQKRNKSLTPEKISSYQSTTSTSMDISKSNEVQNSQVSSTVLGYPKKTNLRYENFSDSSNSSYSSMYLNKNDHVYGNGSYPSTPSPSLPEFSVFKTPPPPPANYLNNLHQHHDIYYPNSSYNQDYYYYNPPSDPASPNFSNYSAQFSNHSSYSVSNPFDDFYSNSILPNDSSEPNEKTINISYTDNKECFQDSEIGGVAISLPHGSILFECAKHELHATTALKTPNRLSPTRISLVFYQHRNMNKPQHGLDEYTEKMRRKLDPSIDSDKPDADFNVDVSSIIKPHSDIVVKTSTLPSYTFKTVFPMFPCIVTGPYQEISPFVYPEKT